MNKDRHRLLAQAAQQHRANLRKNVERRLEAAKEKGDESLVRVLQAELNYIG